MFGSVPLKQNHPFLSFSERCFRGLPLVRSSVWQVLCWWIQMRFNAMALVYSNWSFLIQESFRNGDFPRFFSGLYPVKCPQAWLGNPKNGGILVGKSSRNGLRSPLMGSEQYIDSNWFAKTEGVSGGLITIKLVFIYVYGQWCWFKDGLRSSKSLIKFNQFNHIGNGYVSNISSGGNRCEKLLIQYYWL